MTRLPTVQELGFEVTIAIAAITAEGHIVTVSDRMLSFDNITQADDDALIKAQKLADGWGILFAGNDARLFHPFLDKAFEKLDNKEKYPDAEYSLDDLKTEMSQPTKNCSMSSSLRHF